MRTNITTNQVRSKLGTGTTFPRMAKKIGTNIHSVIKKAFKR